MAADSPQFDPLADVSDPPPLHDLQLGGDFILDAPEVPPAIWGSGAQVLWSRGEGTMVFAPTGVGKTTLAQLWVVRALGLTAADLLGFPVEALEGPILYIAADRPSQIARSFRRMVAPDAREVLNDRLLVRSGPLPFLLSDRPDGLAKMALDVKASAVVIDSLKDVAYDLAKDETGSRVNQAFQHVTGMGCELLVLHHPRKASGDNKKPNQISDVYGSTWLTAGLGSVVCLWGRPSDPILEFTHLKTPAEEIQPFKVLVDHQSGSMEVHQGTDLLAILRASSQGLTARAAAVALYGLNPDQAAIEKARRALRKLMGAGQAVELDGVRRHRWVATTKRREPR
jgi:hypothetical protein